MTANEFFHQLSTITQSRRFTPPIDIQVGPHDALAAKLLLWLQEQMADNATEGDLEDVLDAAKWWTVLFASMYKADGKQKSASEARR